MIVALKEAALIQATVQIDLLYDTQHGTNDFNVYANNIHNEKNDGNEGGWLSRNTGGETHHGKS